jgi:hypothetical protein
MQKRIYLAILLGLFAGSFARGELLGRWTGDGNALDTARTNHGTLANGATYAAGRYNQAFSLDGSDDYVDLPDATSLLVSNSQGTITAWVYPTVIGGNDMVVAFGSGGNGQGIGLGIYGTVRIYHHTGTYDWQSNVPVNGNVWTFLAYTWDGTTERIYTNGVLSESRPRGSFSYVTGKARIGHGFWGDPANAFPGRIDQLMVFDEALASNQVAALFLADAPSVTNVAPASGTFTNTATLNFNWQFSSPLNPPQKTYRLLIGAPGFSVTNDDSGVVTSSTMQHSSTYTGLPDGIYDWKVIATDQEDDSAESAPWRFGKDTTAPGQPTYNTAQGYYVTSAVQLLDIDFQDNLQIDTITYQVDGAGVSYMLASNYFVPVFTNNFPLVAAWNAMTPGYHALQFFIRDRAGWSAASGTDFTFYKDQQPPLAPVYHTAEDTLFDSSPVLDIDFEDGVGLSRIEYRLDDDISWHMLAQDLSAPVYNANWSLSAAVWDALSDGLHLIYFRVTDRAGLQYLTPNVASAFSFRKGARTRIIGLGGNLAFGNVLTGSTATAILTITNAGNSALTVSSISYPAGFSGAWSGSVPPEEATNVTVTFAPVAVQAYSGTVTVISDKTGGENGIGVSGAGIPAPQPGKISFAASSYAALEGTIRKVGVKRSLGAAGTVSVRYWMKPKTALAWQDYTPKSGTLTWTNGQTASKMIKIPIRADGMMEGNETFQVILTTPVGATLAAPFKTTVTITGNNKGGAAEGDAVSTRLAGLADAVDAEELTWFTSPLAAWTKQAGVTADGVDAAISGASAPDRVSWLQADVEGPGTLDYDWLIRGKGLDTGLLIVDGKVCRTLGPGFLWTHETIPVDKGLHAIRWVFAGESRLIQGAAYLDRVNWMPGPLAP